MKAKTKSKQTTFTVGNERITIKSRLRTRNANPVGYRVYVNDKQYDIFSLDRDEAEIKALYYWLNA